MELHVVRIPADTDELKVLVLGDCHVGHRCFDEKLLDSYLSQIDDRTRVLVLGDLFEAGTRKSPGRLDSQVMGLTEQRRFWQEKLGPFKDRIDAAVCGNHEERIPNDGGDNPLEILCELLGIKYLGYRGAVAYASDKSNSCAYTIALWHGSGDGVLPGTSINRAQRQLWNVYADIYLSGHTHKPSMTTNVVWIPNLYSKNYTRREQYIITNGALLNYSGSYAEMKGYPEAKPCQARLHLKMDKRNRQVRVVM